MKVSFNETYLSMRILIILFSITFFSCNINSDVNITYPPGGYEFHQNITNKDFYCYPLIYKISRRDSFLKVYHESHFFKLFKEPNISLEPADHPIIRLVFSNSIITLTQNEIILKESGDRTSPGFDLNKLTEIERKHYIILKMNYPLDEAKPPWIPPAPTAPPGPDGEYARTLDSVKNNTPILLNRAYFDYLLKKAASASEFRFTTTKIKIPVKKFRSFLVKLNQSGYWSLPDNITGPCAGTADPTYFSLEINTGRKYHYVASTDVCAIGTKFYEICEELLKMTKS